MNPLLRRFQRRPIRQKLFITYAVAFMLLLCIGGLVTDILMRRSLESGMESELRNSTQSLLNLMEISLNGSIRNYLRGIADQDLRLVADLEARARRGEMSMDEAKARARAALLSQRIGKTGYTCVLDSGGTMRIHPKPAMVDRNLSEYAFVREIGARKVGYMEYEWQNPDEPDNRPKAMYMSYFAPWDWIILASSYRTEFSELVPREDLRQAVLSLRVGKTGYSFILDLAGNFVAHPLYEGKNFSDLPWQPPGLFEEMRNAKSGRSTYLWRNADDPFPVEKVVIYNQIPEFGWIVGSATNLEEVYAPLRRARSLFLFFIGGSLCLLLALTYRISRTITRPLHLLEARLAETPPGHAPLQVEERSGDEVETLERYFDAYLSRLDAEVAERRNLEREVIETGDRERARIGQELHDDLAPHLAGVEVLCKVLGERLAAADAQEAASAERVRKLLGEASGKVRALARGLCMLHFADRELELTLRDVAAQFETLHGVPCEVRVEGALPRLDISTATQLVCIAREALHNALKHSGAAHIGVAVSPLGGGVRLVVRDDGRGFDSDAQSSGMGLRIMRYRASMIGASLSTRTGQGEGTEVEVVTAQPGEGAA